MNESPPPGWYPQNAHRQYWDGQNWSSPEPKKSNALLKWAGIVIVVLLLMVTCSVLELRNNSNTPTPVVTKTITTEPGPSEPLDSHGLNRATVWKVLDRTWIVTKTEDKRTLCDGWNTYDKEDMLDKFLAANPENYDSTNREWVREWFDKTC